MGAPFHFVRREVFAVIANGSIDPLEILQAPHRWNFSRHQTSAPEGSWGQGEPDWQLGPRAALLAGNGCPCFAPSTIAQMALFAVFSS